MPEDNNNEAEREDQEVNMDELDHDVEQSRFFTDVVGMTSRGSDKPLPAVPNFGRQPSIPSSTLDDEDRRKIQMQWRHNVVQNHKNHRKS